MSGAIVISIVCIACAYLLWRMAEKRGANTLFWAIMGAVFGPFAIPFIFLTAPTAAHALARGAHIFGVRLWEKSIMDKYREANPDIS